MSVHFQDAQKPLRFDPAAIEKAVTELNTKTQSRRRRERR